MSFDFVFRQEELNTFAPPSFHVYIIILMPTPPLLHTYTLSAYFWAADVNERSVADKNDWLLIIKSYIKCIGLVIKFNVNNHFEWVKGTWICRHFLSTGAKWLSGTHRSMLNIHRHFISHNSIFLRLHFFFPTKPQNHKTFNLPLNKWETT